MEGKVLKPCIRAKWSIRPTLISGFSSMKLLGVFPLPSGWGASLSQYVLANGMMFALFQDSGKE